MPRIPARVAVVSPSPVICEGLVTLVGQAGEVAIVVSATEGADARAKCDVVIYDLVSVRDVTAYAELRQLKRDGVVIAGLTIDHPGLIDTIRTTSAVVPLDADAARLRSLLTS